jgi:hypothetical protein
MMRVDVQKDLTDIRSLSSCQSELFFVENCVNKVIFMDLTREGSYFLRENLMNILQFRRSSQLFEKFAERV